MLVGNPIRQSKDSASVTQQHESPRVYVTGGSQGSEFINKNIPKALNSLNIPLEVRHQSGNGKSEGVTELYSRNISVVLYNNGLPGPESLPLIFIKSL